jgi:hypothetical protein
MSFETENIESISVTAFRGEGEADRPHLFVPPLPAGSFVARYYHIKAEPSPASFLATMTLYYDQAEFDKSGISDESRLQLYRFNGAAWELAGGTADAAGNNVTVHGVTAFSYWAFGGSPDTPTSVNAPGDFTLGKSYPNPLRSSGGEASTALIEFSVPASTPIEINIYNLLGQKVRTLFKGSVAAGPGRVVWDGTNNLGEPLQSGIYFYQLSTPQATTSSKLLLIRQ